MKPPFCKNITKWEISGHIEHRYDVWIGFAAASLRESAVAGNWRLSKQRVNSMSGLVGVLKIIRFFIHWLWHFQRLVCHIMII
jgi:hypothetical protein